MPPEPGRLFLCGLLVAHHALDLDRPLGQRVRLSHFGMTGRARTMKCRHVRHRDQRGAAFMLYLRDRLEQFWLHALARMAIATRGDARHLRIL